jgi:uncharacterized protein (UPF0332 family)
MKKWTSLRVAAYYAMFYTAEALLNERGLEFNKDQNCLDGFFSALLGEKANLSREEIVTFE